MRLADSPAPGQDFVPVVLGGDRLGYSLARSFDMAYGYRTVVLSRIVGGPIAHTPLVLHHHIDALDDPDLLVRTLRELAPALGERPLLLLATTDHVVGVLASVADQLRDRYVVPYVVADLIERLSRKEVFARLCAELDIPHPRTVVLEAADNVPERAQREDAAAELGFPLVLKPSNAAAWDGVSFEGKHKVHAVADRAALHALLGTVWDSGYRDRLIAQEAIPGDDQGMRVLNCYVDGGHEVKVAAFGRVLLEEHSPDTLGIPAAIMTEIDPVAAGHATRLLRHIGWHGYANVDMKYDPRTGRTLFFELNPRLGGTSFYLTAAGSNMVLPYVREWVRGEDLSGAPVVQVDRPHLFTAVPVRLLRRYVTDPEVRRRVGALIRDGAVTNPWYYSRERDPRRWAWVMANQANYVRKYRRYYPEPKALI